MGYRDTQENITLGGGGVKYLVANQTKKYSGLDAGAYFFIMGIGTTDKKGRGEFMSVEEMLSQALVYDHAQLYVKEAGERGQYVHWHFTGEHDPLVELGYAYITQGGEPKTTASTTRNDAKLKIITDGKGLYTKYVARQIHFPVAFTEKLANLENAEPAILIVTAAQAQAIFAQGDILALSKGKSVYGNILSLTKDPSKGMQTYTWRLMTENAFSGDDALPTEKVKELEDAFKSYIEYDDAALERVFTEVNGGVSTTPEENSERVWRYLLTISGLTKEEFVKRYNILPTAKVNPTATTTINFGSETSEDMTDFSEEVPEVE